MNIRNSDNKPIMNINRNNYENFFLLYVDGELAPQEMLEVDAFCQKHPDLAEELDLLMDTRLSPETDTVLLSKDELLKPEQWDADHLTPLQSNLLSMLDGEADRIDFDTQRSHNTLLQKEWELLQQTRLESEAVPMAHKHKLIKAVQWDADMLTPLQMQLLEALENGSPVPAGVLADAELQKDWMLLQQTVLTADVVAMPNKHQLYRRESTEKAPVVRMGWLRIAAAAAVIAGIGWVVFNSLSNTENAEPQLSKQQTQKPALQTPSTTNTDTPQVEKEKGQAPVPATDQTQVLLASNELQSVRKSAHTAGHTEEHSVVQQDGYDERMANNIAAYRLSLSEEKALRNNAANDVPDLQDRGRAPITARDYTAAADAVAANGAGNVRFENAVMMEEEEEDEYVFIAGAKVKTQKLRGVFRTVSRKVTRSFEKSTVAPAENMATELR